MRMSLSSRMTRSSNVTIPSSKTFSGSSRVKSRSLRRSTSSMRVLGRVSKIMLRTSRLDSLTLRSLSEETEMATLLLRLSTSKSTSTALRTSPTLTPKESPHSLKNHSMTSLRPCLVEAPSRTLISPRCSQTFSS